jgi:two-component system chemotaxis sensor kinase CheA
VEEADDAGQEGRLQLSQDATFDSEDLTIFRQTVEQQLDNIYLALQTLGEDASQSDYVDGLYRSFRSLQNASEYMGLDEIRVYAERTANLVDQGRNAEQGLEMLLPLLQQETEILENMLQSALTQAAATEGAEPGAQGEDEEALQAPQQEAQPQEQVAKASQGQPEASRAAAPSPEESETGSEKQPAKEDSSKSSAKVSTTIRVEHEKLDHLMNLIGELIINRNRFSLITKELEAGKDVADVVQSLSETTDSMARISDDLQDTIMQVRMVPMRTVFSRFPRLVRDLSRKSGKSIELITEGEDTELDKSVIEAIGDPLVHLIRNAVDHGQERPEERQKAGKSETGYVWLKAFHEGNSVVIVIADDGKGIEPEKVKQKAVSKGIISEEEAAKLEDKEAIELIFAPGFSTSEAVTDVSGRGVGMDVVKNNIKNLNGSVSVQSEVGRGTTFSLSLPLTLAIIEALLVKVGDNTFAIPLDAVSETTKIPADQVKEVNKRWATTLRGEVLGIEDLSRVLGLGNGDGSKEVYPLVVVSVNDRRVGLIVDSLLHRQEIVIKSMGEYLGEVHGLSGATIMGDGSVILILDPSEIMSMTIARNA